MLDEPYENKAYEALKKTMEDRSTWRKSNTKKKKVSETVVEQATVEEEPQQKHSIYYCQVSVL